MEMAELSKEVLKYLAGATGGGAIAYFCVRKHITHFFDKRLKDYDSKLKQKAEVLKAELSVYAHEQQVGISRIDQQRAEAIKNVYGEIYALHRLFCIDIREPFQLCGEGDRERAELVSKACEDIDNQSKRLVCALVENAIYFKSDLYDRMLVYINQCAEFALETIQFLKDSENSANEDKKVPETTTMEVAYNLWSQRTDKVRSALIEEFRLLMKAQ